MQYSVGKIKPGAGASSASAGKGPTNYELFVSAKPVDAREDGTPLAVATVATRKELVEEYVSGDIATAGGVYRMFFWSIVTFIAAVAAYAVGQLYVAALFAFLFGYCWSERLVNQAWSRQWYETKSFIVTK